MLQAIVGHNLKNPVGFAESAAKRDHDHDIGEAHLLPKTPDRAAFQGEAIPILFRVIARGAPEPEHRIVFLWLKLGTADEIGVLIGLEVAHPDDRRLRIERSRDAGEPEG